MKLRNDSVSNSPRQTPNLSVNIVDNSTVDKDAAASKDTPGKGDHLCKESSTKSSIRDKPVNEDDLDDDQTNDNSNKDETKDENVEIEKDELIPDHESTDNITSTTSKEMKESTD